MKIIDNFFGKKSVNKNQIEQVQKEKEEYKLVGEFMRTKGLKLFSYNSLKNELKELNIEQKKTVKIVGSPDGGWQTEDINKEECTVDSRNFHFESLNMKNAIKRLKKYKDAGRMDQLCNLKPPPDPKAMALW